LKQQAGQLLGCSFSSNNYHELHSEGTLPQFVVVKRGEVEHTLLRFRQQQNGTPSMHACFVLGAKVAKSSTIFPLLKSMRVLLQGKKDRNIPYSYVVYYAPPIHCISFCQALAHPELAFIFNVKCGGVSGVALVDTGATHTFVRRSFVNTLGIWPVNTPVSVQLADGQTMTSAGTVSLRLQLSRTYIEQRKFIVCDKLLDGIDVILGNDFLKDRGAFIDYTQCLAFKTSKTLLTTLLSKVGTVCPRQAQWSTVE
jgi:predicted aspartyl protease